jgi:hypothetical protein
LGEFGSVILRDQKVLPRRLIKNGFVFEYPEIGKVLGRVFAYPSDFSNQIIILFECPKQDIPDCPLPCKFIW